MKWTAEITRFEPNKKWNKNINSGSITIDEHVTYSPVTEGMIFSIAYDMKFVGIFRLFSPMVVRSMRKETIKSLCNLKGILETQT